MSCPTTAVVIRADKTRVISSTGSRAGASCHIGSPISVFDCTLERKTPCERSPKAAPPNRVPTGVKVTNSFQESDGAQNILDVVEKPQFSLKIFANSDVKAKRCHRCPLDGAASRIGCNPVVMMFRPAPERTMDSLPLNICEWSLAIARRGSARPVRPTS